MKKSTKTWIIVGVLAAVLYFFWTPISGFFSGIMSNFGGGSSSGSTGGSAGTAGSSTTQSQGN